MERKLWKATLAVVCTVLVLGAVMPLACSARTEESVVSYAQKMVRHYRDHGDPYAPAIRDCLKQITRIDPKAGELWETVMTSWDKCNHMEAPGDVLPNGLPEDDSLCIVVLGFELNPDGSMKKELVSRLEVALKSAKKYPNAYIAVTGGGTAVNSPMTEAEAMAVWLRRKGVDKEHIIVEKESLSTTANAVNTYGILVKDYPEVKAIAIVTSDYHIPWGATMFQTVCDYNGVYGETVIPVVACAANTTTTKMNTMRYQANGICTITGIPYN